MILSVTTLSRISETWRSFVATLNCFKAITEFSCFIRWMPELEEMVQQMRDKIENKTKPRRKVLSTTGKVSYSEIPLLRPPKIKTSIKNIICKV